jgi:hypothetical protein
MNLSKAVLESPGKGGCGRMHPTGSGVEELDQGKVGVVSKKDGMVRAKRAVVRRSVRRGPGEDVGLLG